MWGNGRYDGQYHLWDPIFLDVHILCCSQCNCCSDGRNMCKKGISEKSVWYAVDRFLTTILSVVLSVPFNYMYFDGYTNNKWGDGVINALERMGFNPIISHCAGEFYLDFLDKVITIVLLFLLIRFYKSRKKCKKCSDRNPVVSDP